VKLPKQKKKRILLVRTTKGEALCLLKGGRSTVTMRQEKTSFMAQIHRDVGQKETGALEKNRAAIEIIQCIASREKKKDFPEEKESSKGRGEGKPTGRRVQR